MSVNLGPGVVVVSVVGLLLELYSVVDDVYVRWQEFYDCRCIEDGHASLGSCARTCQTIFYIYVTLQFITFVVSSVTIVPLMTSLVRSALHHCPFYSNHDVKITLVFYMYTKRTESHVARTTWVSGCLRWIKFYRAKVILASVKSHIFAIVGTEDRQLLTDIGRRSLRSADVLTCATVRTRTRLGDRSFSIAGPCLWNSLPVALRGRDISLAQFKRLLKTLWFV